MKTKQNKPIIATAKSSPDPDIRLQIERRAYQIWMAAGSRHGEDVTHWLQAENELLEQQRQARMGRHSAEV